jgi:phenylalanyl-tRNA synthetase alpha chain
VRERLNALREAAVAGIGAAQTAAEIESLRVKYLGKKGEITAVLRQMGSLSAEERPAMGALANSVRADIDKALESRSEDVAARDLARKLREETLDVTAPGTRVEAGRRHPMTVVLDEALDIFISMGFSVAEGPEVELSRYDFDMLNIPANHPAREWSDTFYITEDESVHLRCQTSPVQVRYMEEHKPPIRIISPGRVYRRDELDASHSPMFHQIEGLVVDRGITFGNLKGTLNALVGRLYGEGVKTRFRPHHFPFTEPSCEVDVQCVACGGTGCRVCKEEGWLELLGAGMVHPKVLAGVGIDPDTYSGFAFGVGIDRMTMLRYNIDDIRLLFENDLRFLSQFA